MARMFPVDGRRESEIFLRVGFKGRRYGPDPWFGCGVERDDLQGPCSVSIGETIAKGYRGSLEALLICDRTAARSDLGRCRRGEVNLRLRRVVQRRSVGGIQTAKGWSR